MLEVQRRDPLGKDAEERLAWIEPGPGQGVADFLAVDPHQRRFKFDLEFVPVIHPVDIVGEPTVAEQVFPLQLLAELGGGGLLGAAVEPLDGGTSRKGS